MLQIGYARVDITPEESVPLAGYGNTLARMSQNILSRLYTTCIAITDGDGTTAILFHNDLITTPVEFATPIRQEVSAATGVPFGHIMITATHTHSGPDVSNHREPIVQRYHAFARKKLVACALEAMADRKPATLETGRAYTQNLNFVRHYVASDGGYKGDNFGVLNPNPEVAHTTHVDNEMRLVKFRREGGEDVLLVNWQTHPHRTGGNKKYDISADIIGSMRDAVEAESGCKFIYFNGGAGNVNPHSRIAGENVTPNYLAHGQALARCALDAELHPVDSGKVQVLEHIEDEPINRPSAEKLEAAEKIREFWSRTNDYRASVELAESYGFNSPYAAGAMFGRYHFPSDTLPMPMYAISLGDVAFATAPYEMFDTNAKYIRDNSPFETTVVATCTNDQNSYIPSAYGFIHGCYEADCSLVRPGTGERYACKYVQMLRTLYETK